MKNKLCSRRPRRPRISLLAAALAAAVLCAGPRALADSPGWLRALAGEPLPAYPKDTEAVLLLNERVTTVKNNGEIETLYRRAYKILRTEGRDRGTVVVSFDKETRLTYLKAWCIPVQGKEYEVKEKDAIETSYSPDALYQDTHLKILKIPASEPGNVVGYEYVQKRRPFVLQDDWWFQDDIPVRLARFRLQLPSGWEISSSWANYAGKEPQISGQTEYLWELKDIPGVEKEPEMPPWRAVAGRLAVTYYPRDPSQRAKSSGSWHDVGVWYAGLTAESRQATPAIKQKVTELTAAAPTTLDKMRALAAFLQREVRYVAIEIGIGGFQPHPASDVFTHRYGDCKDKVTLLSTMLHEVGIESYYVLIDSQRGIVLPKFPSATGFNHAILALRLPQDVPTTTLYAVMDHPKLGKLLFFDPTDAFTPLGYLPPTLQANNGLLVTPEGGELIELPLQAPGTNRLLRVAKLTLDAAGALSGSVEEVRWGSPAIARREQFLQSSTTDSRKVLESFLGIFLGGFVLTTGNVENLQKYDESLIISYQFVAQNYAKRAGNLLLVRPRVLGEKGGDLLEGKPRKYPVEFPDATRQDDVFEINMPHGYVVDELPAPVRVDFPFADYHSQIEVAGNTLSYKRTYEIKQVMVPTEHLAELKEFFHRIAADERSTAVLRRAEP